MAGCSIHSSSNQRRAILPCTWPVRISAWQPSQRTPCVWLILSAIPGAEQDQTVVRIDVNIDCTPDEARAFFGLPNVKPMQEAMMARMERQMLDAAAAMSPDAVLKMWFR